MFPGLTGSPADLVSLLGSSAWKSAVLFALAIMLARLAGCRTAAVRHLIWTTSLLGALAMPLFELALPAWKVPVRPTASSVVGADVSAAAVADDPSAGAGALVAMAEGDTLRRTSRNGIANESFSLPSRGGGSGWGGERQLTSHPHPNLPPSRGKELAFWPAAVAPSSVPEKAAMILLAWLVGVGIIFVPVMIGRFRLERLAARAARVGDLRLLSAFESARTLLGVRRRTTLLLSDERPIPMTWGWLRPVLLLPAAARDWPVERLQIVILHELIHVARYDYVWQLAGSAARALYWFNPLAWWACRQLRHELERACDDRVLTQGTDPSQYAYELLQITSQFPMPRFAPSAALAVGRKDRLQRRIESILDETQERGPMNNRLFCGIALPGLALVLLLATFGGTALRADDPERPGAGSTTGDTARTADPASAAADPQNADAQEQKGEAPARRITEARAKILNNFVRSPDEQALDAAAIRGMLQSLNDPYSAFLSAETLKDFETAVEGALTGIGLELKPEDQQLTVITALPGSPARTAGLKSGDAVLSVDGRSIGELGSAGAVKKIRGPAGSVVVLEVRKAGGATEKISVTRAAIRLSSVKGLQADDSGKWNFWLDREQKLAYIRITDFSKPVPELLQTTLKELLGQGLKGTVLDLRHCPGGLLASATAVADLFLREGTIVSIKGVHAGEQVLQVTGKNYAGDFPLLILIDEQTASAAEILAGALKENRRATLLGSRSLGKGSVQSLLPVDGAGAIRLTTAYFFLPGERPIDRQTGKADWGVDPSDGFFVPLTAQQQADWQKHQRRRETMTGLAPALPERGAAAIAAALEGEFADPQLALAYRSLAARVSSGTFAKVGQSEQALREFYARRELLLKQRAEAAKQIEQIDKELSAASGKAEPGP